MPVERPHIPPPRKAVSEFTTPVPTEAFYIEVVGRNDAAYYQNAPVKRGTLYSTIIGADQNVIAAYPNLYFLKETRLGTSDQLVLWHWATDRTAESSYNAEISYDLESVTSPTFARVYTIRRDVYDNLTPIAQGTAFTGLIGVNIEDGGAGYTFATGTIDTGAIVQFVIDANGSVTSGVVTNEGSSVTSGASITITGDGQGAEATAIIQPATAILVSQKKQEFPEDNPLRNEYVKVIRIYETLPGAILTGTSIDAAGDKVTETRQKVVASTIVTTITTAGGVYTKTFEEPINDNAYIAWKVIQVKATQNTLDSYEAEIPDLLPEEFRPGVPVTTHEETLIGIASSISLPLATGVLMERKAQIDFNTYRHTLRGRIGISLPQTITNKEITSEFGGGDINRTLTLDLFNNLTLDEGLVVLASNIRKIDDQANGLAVKTSRILNDVAWPIIHGTHVDEKYGLVVNITKQTVAEGTVGGVLGDGTVVEVKTHDKWKSIQIASKFDESTIPADVQWPGAMQHSFPPELTDAVIDWASAFCGCSSSFSAILVANVKQYSGMVKTRITEQFFSGPPPDNVTIYQMFPQSHHFGYAWSSFCGSSDSNCRTKSGAPEFHIPLCLHGDLTLSIGIYTFWHFPPTSPSVLPHGTYVMLAPHVERWRFGVFRRVLTEVLIP